MVLDKGVLRRFPGCKPERCFPTEPLVHIVESRDLFNSQNFEVKKFKALRHNLGCQLLDQGENMDLVCQQLRHTKVERTRR